MRQFLEAGKIVGTHGVKGELKLECWTDSPSVVKKAGRIYFDEGSEDAGLESSRLHKNLLLITLKDVNDASKADLLRGKVVYLDRKDIKLQSKQYFIADLIGLEVYDGKNGQYYGVIEDVFKTGANSVYKIVNQNKEYLFPAVDHMIKSTDIEKNRIEVLPIDGIFDDGGYSDAD